MMLFPKVLVLATTLPKIDKNSIFLLNCHQKFPKFSQNFPKICSFRPNARKINAWFVIFFEKYGKIMYVSQFSYENVGKFLNISQKFVFFVQIPEKLTHALLIFRKYFLRNLFEHFRDFLKYS